MTTKFDSKEDVKDMASSYLNFDIKNLDGIVPEKSNMFNPLDFEREHPEEIEIYTVKNRDDKEVSFAIGNYRDGYDLWLMSESGVSIRV
jgi:hypothetical protein